MDDVNKQIEGRQILITGGTGFIASHISERLIDRNQITVFDNNKRNAMQHAAIKDHKNLTYIQGDVRDPAALESAVEGHDTVIHCAAIAGIDSVGQSPVDTMEVNLIGTYNLLNATKDKDLKCLLDFSTSEVYGPHIYKGTEEYLTSQGPVGKVRWTYAVSKLAAEHMSHAFQIKHGLPVVSVRPFNVYGPRQVGEGAIQKFIINAVKGDDIVINGDGSQIRAWCYVDDFVDCIMQCLVKKEAIGEVFNIGTPQAAVSIHELARLVISLAGSTSQVIHRPALEADVEVRVPSIDKAKTLLDYDPKVDLAAGIKATLDWYQSGVEL